MPCGYEDRDGEACKTRLHTLVTAYRQYKDELRRQETPHQAKNHHSSTSWIKYYPISRVHNQKLPSIRQQLLRLRRVKRKVKILRSSRRTAAAATTTVVVVAVLLKYFRSIYGQVICSRFSRINCHCKCFFFLQAEVIIEMLKCHRRQKNYSQGRHENLSDKTM